MVVVYLLQNNRHHLKCISDCQENTEEMTVERDSQNFTTDEEMDHKPPSLESKGDSPKREASSSPGASSDIDKNSNDRSPNKNDITISIPKLRLNTSLALDPALNSDAKDLKKLHEETNKQLLLRLKQQQQEEEPVDSKDNILIRPAVPSVPPALVEATSQGQLIFSCQPCGITFSKRSTFEAHQTYYCSHRKEGNEAPNSKTNSSTPGSSSSGENNSTGDSSAKPSKTGKLYNCPHCSYGADKKLSLNRHMRMHQPSPSVASNASASNGEDSSQHADRYCFDCDIKFQTINVYRAHKKHYCNSRRSDGQTTPKSELNPNSSGAAISPQLLNRSETPNAPFIQPPESFIVLQTNPIMIIPHALIQSGRVFQGPMSVFSAGLSNSENNCYVAENGSLRVVATAAVPEVLKTPKQGPRPRTPVVTPVPIEKPPKSINNNNNEPKHVKKEGPRETTPLDLSLRKTPPSSKRQRVVDDDIEPLEVKDLSMDSRNSLTPEQIVCAPSLPNSPSMSPSPKRRLLSPRSSGSVSVPIESPIPNILPDQLNLRPMFPPELARTLEMAIKTAAANAVAKQLDNSKAPISASTSSSSPQIYVKQGSWKCKECNIVFCKYENYHAHKQHYCSARNQDSDVDGKSASLSPIMSQNPADNASYQQLICAACGIKYASLENLKAHQKHYCGKGAANVQVLENQMTKERCMKCKTYHDPNQQCSVVSHSSQNSYKCPVCDVISLTAADSKKHLETHGQVKAFKCNCCGYRGSTLRGMKTHIRMQHFDKKTPDLNEEDYMSCILEENDSDIPAPHSQQSSPPIPGQSPLIPPQMYFCELCKYSSPYKGNLIRHMKQHQSPYEAASISPDITDDVEVRSHNGEKHTLEDRVKIEPVATPPPQNHHALIPQIKMEPDVDIHNETITASIAIGARSHTPVDESYQSSRSQYCEHCDINFQMMKSYIAHKEFYCKNRINHGSIVVDDNDNSRSSPATALQT